MATVDLIVIILYLVVLLFIGLFFTKRISNSEDYFVAGRSLGLFPMIATVCATIIGGGAMIGRGGVIYQKGIVGIWLALPYFIGMIGFSLIADRINKVGQSCSISSIPELMERRFGRSVKLIFSILIAYTMMATVGSQISATATIIKMVGQSWGISYELGAVIATVIFVTYTSASGLFGVVYTDVVQFVILILSIYILVPIISLTRAGGFGEMISQLPEGMMSLHPDTTIIGYIFTNLLFSFAGAEMWQRAFASRNQQIAKKGMLFGTCAYGVTIFSTLILGLSARVLLPDVLTEYGTADAAIPALIIKILPVGLTGLAIAGLLAVMMSSSDSYLLVSTQTIIKDIIGLVKPDLCLKKELLYSRIITPILGFLAMFIALYIKSAYEALMFAWTFYAASVGLPAFAALYWKKATKAGIISAVAAGFGFSMISRIFNSPFGLADSLVGGIACLITLIAVSLMTYRRKAYPLCYNSEEIHAKHA